MQFCISITPENTRKPFGFLMSPGGKAIQHWAEIGLTSDIQKSNSNFKQNFYYSTYDSLCLTYLDKRSLIW